MNQKSGSAVERMQLLPTVHASVHAEPFAGSWPEGNPPRVVDLFCGAGGLSEGFRQAGFRVAAGADNDPDAMATFARNFPEAQLIVGDIRSAENKERVLQASRGVSVLIGGPPCQAFSQVRNHTRMIDDPRNSLYREFVEVLAESLPLAFVMENVTGLDQMGARDQIETDLSLDGEYQVRPQVVDAADVGVPQTRKRLLFVGVRASLGISPPLVQGSGATQFMALTRQEEAVGITYRVGAKDGLAGPEISERLRDPEDLSVVSVLQAIGDLATLPTGNRIDTLEYAEFSEPSSAYQRVMRHVASGHVENTQVPRMNEDTRLRLLGLPPGGNYRDLAAPVPHRTEMGPGQRVWSPLEAPLLRLSPSTSGYLGLDAEHQG